MKTNELFNSNDVLVLDEVLGGKGSATVSAKGGKDNWEVSVSITFTF